MATAPRNHRTKQPRSLRPQRLTGPPSMRHAYRYGSAATPTPTPPPVAVSLPAPAAEPHEPAPAPTARRGVSSMWWWFAMSALVCAASAAMWRHYEPSDWLSHHLEPIKMDKQDPPTAALLQLPAPAAKPAPESPWKVRHDGPIALDGGTLLLPKSFTSRQGDHDLIIHFHGDAELVRQSVSYAKLNVALAVINLGEGAQPYTSAYQQAGAFEALLEQIRQGLARRGVKEPRLSRLALTSWGPGYAAIASILEHRRAPHAGADPLDAIVTLDGLHARFVDGDRRRLDERSMLPFVRAAQAAADDALMFSITHSRLRATGHANSERSAALILDQVGVERSTGPTLRIPARVSLPASAAAGKQLPRLLPLHDTRVGGLRVQGFDGDTPGHHAAHLAQMASIGLVDLASRWSRPRAVKTAMDAEDAQEQPPADEVADADERAADDSTDADESADAAEAADAPQPAREEPRAGKPAAQRAPGAAGRPGS